MTTGKPILFFDGGCPLCRREISHYRKLDREQRIEWVDIHADPECVAAYGIDWATAMQRIHLIDKEGRIQTGAYAFVTLWSALPYYRWLSLICRIPGLTPLMDFGYTSFACWRWARRAGSVCPVKH